MAHNNLQPNDPALINKIVSQIKETGIFDEWRQEISADVDTKPAYHNLCQRAKLITSRFLEGQKYTPDLVKNEFRDRLRRKIMDSNLFTSGVSQIAEDTVNSHSAKIYPAVKESVLQFMNKQEEEQKNFDEQNGQTKDKASSSASVKRTVIDPIADILSFSIPKPKSVVKTAIPVKTLDKADFKVKQNVLGDKLQPKEKGVLQLEEKDTTGIESSDNSPNTTSVLSTDEAAANSDNPVPSPAEKIEDVLAEMEESDSSNDVNVFSRLEESVSIMEEPLKDPFFGMDISSEEDDFVMEGKKMGLKEMAKSVIGGTKQSENLLTKQKSTSEERSEVTKSSTKKIESSKKKHGIKEKESKKKTSHSELIREKFPGKESDKVKHSSAKTKSGSKDHSKRHSSESRDSRQETKSKSVFEKEKTSTDKSDDVGVTQKSLQKTVKTEKSIAGDKPFLTSKPLPTLGEMKFRSFKSKIRGHSSSKSDKHDKDYKSSKEDLSSEQQLSSPSCKKIPKTSSRDENKCIKEAEKKNLSSKKKEKKKKKIFVKVANPMMSSAPATFSSNFPSTSSVISSDSVVQKQHKKQKLEKSFKKSEYSCDLSSSSSPSTSSVLKLESLDSDNILGQSSESFDSESSVEDKDQNAARHFINMEKILGDSSSSPAEPSIQEILECRSSPELGGSPEKELQDIFNPSSSLEFKRFDSPPGKAGKIKSISEKSHEEEISHLLASPNFKGSEFSHKKAILKEIAHRTNLPQEFGGFEPSPDKTNVPDVLGHSSSSPEFEGFTSSPEKLWGVTQKVTLSDIEVSSVGTDDLSSFDDKISLDSDSDLDSESDASKLGAARVKRSLSVKEAEEMVKSKGKESRTHKKSSTFDKKGFPRTELAIVSKGNTDKSSKSSRVEDPKHHSPKSSTSKVHVTPKSKRSDAKVIKKQDVPKSEDSQPFDEKARIPSTEDSLMEGESNRSLRRKRKINPKYASSEFASIFNSKHKSFLNLQVEDSDDKDSSYMPSAERKEKNQTRKNRFSD